MYLTDSSFFDLVKRQYLYKLKAYRDVFTGLLIIHLLTFLMSYNGVGSISSSTGNVIFSLKTYSDDLFMILTMVWIFITAIQFTGKKHRDSDFSFSSTRLSSAVSSASMLMTVAAISGIVTYLAGNTLKVMVVLLKSDAIMRMANFYISPGEFLRGIAVSILYMILAASIGYFA